MEEWKPVTGFPLYEISSLGRLRKIMLGHPDRSGFWRFSLANGDGKYVHPKIDELVAEHFLDGDGKLNHIDGDRSNNAAENLEYE